MSDQDTDFDTDPGSAGSEPPSHYAQQEAQQAKEKASDDRLDRAVRDAAQEVFSRDRDLDTIARKRSNDGTSMDATIRQAYADIAARPEPLQMPALPGEPTIEQTLEARQKWEAMPLATKRDTVNAHSQVAELKSAAERFGLEVKTVDDFVKLKAMMDGDRSNGSPDAGPNPVWEKVGIGHEVQSDAEALERLDDFASRHAATFARNGVSMAEGIEYLMAAQELLERDPQAGINMLAQSYGVAPQGDASAQVMPALVEEFAATKSGGLSPAVRRAMAEVIYSDHRLFSGNLPAWQVLQTAFSEVKRRQAVRAKREPHKKLEDAVDQAAAGIYRR